MEQWKSWSVGQRAMMKDEIDIYTFKSIKKLEVNFIEWNLKAGRKGGKIARKEDESRTLLIKLTWIKCILTFLKLYSYRTWFVAKVLEVKNTFCENGNCGTRLKKLMYWTEKIRVQKDYYMIKIQRQGTKNILYSCLERIFNWNLKYWIISSPGC